MKKLSVVYLCTLASLLSYAGCTSEVSVDDEVGVAKQHLTIEQCEAQRDQCLEAWGLVGLVNCNLEFTLCSATSEVDLPEAVSAAIEDAAACRAALDDCVLSAETPMELAACAEDQALCIADILDIGLPEVVTGTAACVDEGMACINSAETLSDLQACGETMSACAINEATAVLPDPVGDAINEVAACNFALDDCIREASTPAELTACGRTQAECVATGLGVELPELPEPGEVVGCAETAIDCTFEARSISEVAECTEGFRACATDVVNIPNIPDRLDCQVTWVRCLFENPFGFIPCAEELRSCLAPETEEPADEEPVDEEPVDEEPADV